MVGNWHNLIVAVVSGFLFLACFWAFCRDSVAIAAELARQAAENPTKPTAGDLDGDDYSG